MKAYLYKLKVKSRQSKPYRCLLKVSEQYSQWRQYTQEGNSSWLQLDGRSVLLQRLACISMPAIYTGVLVFMLALGTSLYHPDDADKSPTAATVHRSSGLPVVAVHRASRSAS